MKYTNPKWWLPKLLCLIAAFSFWIYVMNEQNPLVENSYTVPVEIRNLDRSLVATNVPPKVKVVVRMNRSDMIGMRSDNIKAYVDLEGVSNGTYPNTPIHISVPGNETVVSQSQSFFDLIVDTYAVKTLPAQIEFIGTPPQGFKAEKKSVTPDYITIAGASHQVESADRAIVSVNVASKNKDFEEFDTVNVLDSAGNTVTGIDVMPTRVRASVHMAEDQKTKNINFKPVIKGNPAEGYKVGKISVSPPVATVKAPGSYFDTHNEIETEELDISGATDTVTKRLDIPKPEHGMVIPGTATVTVEIEKE